MYNNAHGSTNALSGKCIYDTDGLNREFEKIHGCNEEGGLHGTKVGKLSVNDGKNGFKLSKRNVYGYRWINGNREQWESHTKQ